MMTTIVMWMVAAGYHGAQAEAPEWSRYEDPAGGFSLLMPAGWQVELAESGAIIVSEDDSHAAAVCIGAGKGNTQADAETVAGGFSRQLAESAPGLRRGGIGHHKDAIDIYTCGVSFRRGNHRFLGHLTVQCLPNGLTQLFYLQADAPRFAALRPILQRVLSSFEWSEGGSGQ